MAVAHILLLLVVAAALLVLVSPPQLLDWVPDILTSSPVPSLLDNTLFQLNPTTTTTTTYTPSSHTPPCLVPSWFWRAHRRDAIADLSAPSWGSCQTDLCIFIRRLVFCAEGHQLRVPSAIRCWGQGIVTGSTRRRTSSRKKYPQLRLRPPRDPARSQGRAKLAVDAMELYPVPRRLCAYFHERWCAAGLGGL